MMKTKLAIALCASLMMALASSVVATAADYQAGPTAPVFYTVKPGDSLSSIAKARLGDVEKWRQLYAMNRSVVGNNPNRLVVGEVLMLVPGTVRKRPKSTLAGPQVSHSGPVLINSQAAAKIKHVFVIMQENHTFDNYFGTFPGADGLSAGLSVPVNPGATAGAVVEPYHLPNLRTQDLDHSEITARNAFNSGRMDGFVAAQQDRNLPGSLALGYYDSTDIPFYWDLAKEYVLADRFFSSAMGGSLANHQYWVAGMDSGKGESIPAEGIQLTTIFDRLQNAGFSWKFYVKNYDPSLNFRHIVPSNPRNSEIAWVPLLTIPSVVDDPSKMARIQDLGNLYHDLADGTAPSVSYIIQGGTSEHPPGHVGNGQNATVGIITAIMRSQEWKDSAIVLTWDDWGGWYDHVVPPQVDADGYGFRVPTLIISPYAKQGYILKETADFTSILKFIETLHGLAPLTSRDESATDLMAAFDFEQVPRVPSQPQPPADAGGFPLLAARGPSPVTLLGMYGVIGGLALLLLALAALSGQRRRRAR
jgi:phospholipase C